MKTTERFERLCTATERGCLEEVVRLITLEPSLVRMNVPGRGTPVHTASAAGQLDVVRILIEHGAESDADDDLGQTPHDLATQMKHTKVARLLAPLRTRSRYGFQEKRYCDKCA